ncbi:protein phosphatase ppm-1.G [Hetaerina americana]|uniref:protein phosphatase ppm-1.G n=1 Tax=Hetaerina americana TaxID=62018 RepID=UPI003A7F5B8B
MGAFLSEPVTEKVSTDEQHSRLNFGVCSMQGWRFTQEDNHSCFPALDDDSSLFGVYDGHGGAEVSRYVASLLPEYVLARECWTKGEVGKALSEAFLSLDAHLGSRKGLRVLKRLAAEDDAALDQENKKEKSSGAEEDGDSEDGSEENVRFLFKEAKMPLEMLMAKYEQALAARRNAAEAEADGESSPTGLKKDKEPNAATSGSDERAEGSAGDEEGGGSSSAAKKAGEGGSEDDGTPKENGLEDEADEEGDKGSSAKNGVPGGRSKLRCRSNRIVMTDDDDDEDSSDEEYDENSSSLMGEGESESSGDEDDDEDGDEEGEDLERPVTTCDEFALNMLQGPGLDSGCTAVVAVVRKGGELYVANAGDSRCILSRKGRAVDMSVDHKPEDDAESERIREAGGEVTSEGRVNGGLNLSRALGDHAYKQGTELGARKQMISALPDVRRVQLRKDEDEFMVLACDGIWNSMTSQDVIDFVRERLFKGLPLGDSPSELQERRKATVGAKLSEICGEMFDACLAPNTCGDGTGCDNMTAILVTFREELWDKGEGKKEGDAKEVEVAAQGNKADAVDKEKAEGKADEKEKAESEEGKEEEEDHGIVLLTPPPSPPPVVAEDDEEEMSEEENDEDEEEKEEEEEELDEKAEEEEKGVSNGHKGGVGKGSPKGSKKRPPADAVEAEETILKKRKVAEATGDESAEGEDNPLSAS